ncbi:hypothetical protein HN682_07885 [Candidatus Peregrinibacteria bacterium]|nr:hypothetical protein [Candidatus Peregrinibacteria bacterium]
MNIRYVHWSEAIVGEYCTSDDGVVAITLAANEYANGSKYIRCPWGRFISRKTTKLLVKDRKGRYDTKGRTYDEFVQSSQKHRLIAKYLANNYNLEEALKWMFGDKLTNTKRHKWRKTIKTKAMEKMIGDELETILEERGLTKGDTIDLMNYVINKAKDEGKLGLLMEMIDKLQRMHGISEPPKTSTQKVLTATSTTEMIDSIRTEELKLEENHESYKSPKKEETEETEAVEVAEVLEEVEQNKETEVV